MLETRPGVYFWQARHPDWEANEGWEEIVTSYALDDGERLIVIDPLAAPQELELLAGKRETAIVLTCPWHARDAVNLADRLGAKIYLPPPDDGDSSPVEGNVYTAGDDIGLGIEAIRGLEDGDLVLWIPEHSAVAAGDTLIDRGEGLIFPLDWAARHGDPDEIRRSLQPLLDHPVDVVLPTHGLPTDRDALARALS
ncbi:MAG TPA: MBL fold metallo-hydrolase [Solirubrobacteraceae bacterium]|nr:MBL fold metallo-hydrolase [Solirubrobacteraceae bacterium]